MAVLPNAFRDDKRGLGVELAKNFHPHLLRVYEPVPLRRVITMRVHRRPAFRFERAGEDCFHFFLLRPAFLWRARLAPPYSRAEGIEAPVAAHVIKALRK